MGKNSSEVRVALKYTVDKTDLTKDKILHTVKGCQGKVEDFMRVGADSILLEKEDEFTWSVTAYINAERADYE